MLKYGYPIGVATRDIAPGDHVHSHNLTSTLRDDFDPSKHAAHQRPLATPVEKATFDGFRRADGRVGMRNEIWIVNTVGCVNNAAERIAAAARKEMESGGGDWGSVDGVHAFPHQFGCSQLGDDLDLTQKILAGLVRHPNAGGVLILGLGCENNQMKLMLESVGNDLARPRAVLQRAGSRRRGRGGDRAHPPAGGVRGQGEARADSRQGADPGDEVRRQRRAVRASPRTRWSARSPTGSRRWAAPCC